MVIMTVEQLEAAILKLPANEFQKLQEWFLNLDNQRWDEELEKDIADGKLEDLAQEAQADFESGRYRVI